MSLMLSVTQVMVTVEKPVSNYISEHQRWLQAGDVLPRSVLGQGQDEAEPINATAKCRE